MSYTFLRWVRFGVAASLSDDVIELGGGPRARITVGVNVSAGALARHTALAIDVLGPADVAGVDHRQVVRTFPLAGTMDFEHRYLAHLELDRPDLPWLFTPTPADASGVLRPWICLVVVEKRDGVKVEQGTPLPRLKMADNAGAELPALTDAHFWVHTQVSGDLDDSVDRISETQPERVISRLVCPRALQADKSYYACLVPTFKVGVDAGLGVDVTTTATLDPAWTGTTASIELPVYYHWEFSTGASGDFKSLVTRLQARTDIPGVGTRPLDITSPGFGVADSSQLTVVDLGGALRATVAAGPPIDQALADKLTAALTENGLTPPIYGRWHAGSTDVSRAAGVPGWLKAINLDPRYRVAAGLGTQVVQERQEDLMAAVWEQFGEILRANQLLRQAQLAIAASERVVGRHFAPLGDPDLLSIAGPALGRILISNQRTARRVVSESCAPTIAFSGAFRRIVRTRGPLGRRFTRLKTPGFADVMHLPAVLPSNVLESLGAGIWSLGRPAMPAGAVVAPATLLPTDRPGGRGRPVRLRPDRLQPLGELLPIFARLAAADRPPACTGLDYGTLGGGVRHALTPDVAIPPRVRAQLALPKSSRLHLSDRLDPVMAAPEILTPMIGPLQALGQDWLLPGLGNVPPNTVTIAEPDAAFIEAYLVGLNHEMGRELLWRGFPTDQRGTVFSRFWDRRGAVSSTNSTIPARDISAIATWQERDALGSHLAGADLMLLIRGDLLARYPRATIYMQQARWKRVQNQIVRTGNIAEREPVPLPDAAAWDAYVHFPSMTGRAGADVTFLGFPLGRADAVGLNRTGLPTTASDADAGWYVVFQEQPTEPRFGYPLGPPAIPAGVSQAEALAAALLRPAFRLFVHASDLVSA